MQNPFDDGDKLKRTQVEYRLQVAVVKHLDSTFPGLLWTHVPNRPSDAQDGYFKKQMGVRPGVADLLFWWKSEGSIRFGGEGREWDTFHAGAIELKAPDGRRSSEQNKFGSSFVHIGGKFAVCKSVQEVHDALCSWGIKPAHNGIVEADLRSDMDKKRDAFSFYAP